MMIIRVGTIFPPLTFPSDFPDFPHPKGMCMCACGCVYACLADAILDSPKKAGDDGPSLFLCSWHRLTCHGRFVIAHNVSLSSPFFPHFSLGASGHLPSTCLPSRGYHFDSKT